MKLMCRRLLRSSLLERGFEWFYTGTASRTKVLLLVTLVAAGLFAEVTLRAAGLFNTGVDDNGSVLPDNQPDLHYQIVEGPIALLPSAPVTVNWESWQFAQYWTANDATGSPGSKWISWTAGAESPTFGAVYVYRTTFTLPEGVSPNALRITGEWGGDDVGRALLLNGVPTGNRSLLPRAPSFDVLAPFVISEGFKTGENTLDFVITDDGGVVTGFRVANIHLEMNATAPTVHSLAADFSVNQNPNGVWSYGWSESRGSAFHFDSTTGEETLFGDLIGWTAPNFGDASLHIAYAAASYVEHPMSTSEPTISVPRGTINVRPGPNGQNSVIRWTAPSAGTYQIWGWFSGNDYLYLDPDYHVGIYHGTTTDVAVLRGTTPLFSGEIQAYRGSGLPFTFVQQLESGQTIDFTIGYGSDGKDNADSTAVDVTIRPILSGDLNLDGCVDRIDLALLMSQIRTHSTDRTYDLNNDGKVDVADARFLVLHFTNPGGLPCGQ